MPPETVTHAEPVMGTVVSFCLPGGDISREAASEAIEVACTLLHQLDAIFSTWIVHSPMNRYRSGQITLDKAPPAIAEVLTRCEVARELSKGWFDPWAMPGGVDPTGLVKGWAVERCLDVLRSAGLRDALVNAGGDVGVMGEASPGQPWQIGIRHPWRADSLARVIPTRVGVATSGPYERGFHLVNPFTTKQAHPGPVASATVTGPSLALADALATAAAVAGRAAVEFVSDIDGYELYLIGADGSEVSTAGLRITAGLPSTP